MNYSAALYFTKVLKNKSGSLYKKSLDELVDIDVHLPLGDDHINIIWKSGIDPFKVSGEAKSFYYYQEGINLFDKIVSEYLSSGEVDRKRFNNILDIFSKVGKKGRYYAKSNFYMGVINSILENNIKAIEFFKKSIAESRGLANSAWIKDQAYMNM